MGSNPITRAERKISLCSEIFLCKKTQNNIFLDCTSFMLYAVVAQSVERIHGKNEVSGSIPDNGSLNEQRGFYL